MEDHLRLAQARGSLQAPNSRVQDLALKILIKREDRVQVLAEIDALKRELIPGVKDFNRLHNLFPQHFTKEWLDRQTMEDAKDQTGQFNIDLLNDEAVDWGVPTPEEDEAMSRWIAEKTSGQASLADANNGWV